MTESIITTKKPKNKIVNNDFGLFEVYFYNSDGISDSAVLTADGVVNWDNKKYGKADFESQGQHYGVYSIFQLNFVSGSEIQKLDELISPLGDKPESYLKIVWFLKRGYSFQQLDTNQIKNEGLFIYAGSSFADLKKEAANELFEKSYPEDYAAWQESLSPGLTFDHEKFFNAPMFETMEKSFGDEKYLIVKPLC